MNKSYLFTGIGLLKAGTVLLGLVVLTDGLYSHFGSVWRRDKLYQICNKEAQSHKELSVTCPPIALEIFFVAVITSGFSIAVLSLVIIVSVKSANFLANEFRVVDLIYHGIYSILLLMGASMFIYSAAKIDQLEENNDLAFSGPGPGLQTLSGAKIFAGVLALKLALLYFITFLAIFREPSQDSMMSTLLL